MAKVESDPASAFEVGVLAPLAALPEPDGAPKYILVDALDEALLLDEGANVLNMLVTRLSRFPTWLRLLATTRPKPHVLRKLRGLKSQLLDAEDDRNRADVRAFTIRRIEEPRFDNAVAQLGKSREETADLLLEVSSGNFLYVTQALDAVGQRQLTIADLLELPPGLEASTKSFSIGSLLVKGPLRAGEACTRSGDRVAGAIKPCGVGRGNRFRRRQRIAEHPRHLGRLRAGTRRSIYRVSRLCRRMADWVGC